jgi:hypothetical protein
MGATMQASDIDDFDAKAAQLRTDLQALLTQCDATRLAIETVQTTLHTVNRSVSTLRRAGTVEIMGALNSLSAANARHQSLGGNLQTFEVTIATFEETVRDITLLHPSVITALRERLAATTEPPP